MSERMYDRMNDRMDGRMDGRMNDRMDGRMNDRMDGRMDGRMNDRMNDRMDGRINDRMNDRMDGRGREGKRESMSERTRALRKIQQLNFAMIELGLYLNNQPKCREALDLYDKVKCMHEDAKARYEEIYGPLTYEGVNTKKDGWSWINEPWPWEGGC